MVDIIYLCISKLGEDTNIPTAIAQDARLKIRVLSVKRESLDIYPICHYLYKARTNVKEFLYLRESNINLNIHTFMM